VQQVVRIRVAVHGGGMDSVPGGRTVKRTIRRKPPKFLNDSKTKKNFLYSNNIICSSPRSIETRKEKCRKRQRQFSLRFGEG
jgi:hypothetical protein